MMLTLLGLVPLLLQAQRQPPQRPLPDPGIIATGQRVTPAGVQTVFTGRVAGVRFGETPGDIWVAVPGSAYRLDWRANRVIARAIFDGRPGVHAIALDPITRRVFVSSVGRLPAAPGVPRGGAVTQLTAFRSDTSADPLAPTRLSGALGDYMGGAPAIAARAGSDGRRLAIVPLPANDSLAVLDADQGTLIRKIALGVAPIASVISANGGVAYVSLFGGPKPKPGERSTPQCCDPRAEPVRVTARGIAERGAVSRVDLSAGRVTRTITVGLHPTALAWDTVSARLFVADGNSDALSVIDTRADTVLTTISIAPFREHKIGLAPTALALSPDRRTLFVALGGANAVAMYDVAAATGGDRQRAQFKGLIPTGWYPSSIDVSADGRYLVVGALFGVGAGEATSGGLRGRFALAALEVANDLGQGLLGFTENNMVSAL